MVTQTLDSAPDAAVEPPTEAAVLAASHARLVLSPAQHTQALAAAADWPTDYPLLWGAYRLHLLSAQGLATCLSAMTLLPALASDHVMQFRALPNSEQYVPLEDCRRALVVPFDVTEQGTLVLACADPSHPAVRSILHQQLTPPTLAIVSVAWLERTLDRMAATQGGALVDVTRAGAELRNLEAVAQRAGAGGSVDQATEVVRAVDTFLRTAIAERASDLHFVGTREGLQILIRVDGELRPLDTVTPSPDGIDAATALRVRSAIVARLLNLARLPSDRLNHEPLDGRFEFRATTSGAPIDVRLNAAPIAAGPGAVRLTLRLMADDDLSDGLESLGLPPSMLTQLRTALDSDGVILVTGPTGSGKTTTLHMALADIYDPRYSFQTIEHPVERKSPHLSQYEVDDRPNSTRTFAHLLRAVLRQDPDVIMCGEIRDPETADLVMQAARTGHGVLSTLHTNTALESIGRLNDLGVSTYTIGENVRAIVAQRLVGRLCRACALDPQTMDDASRAAHREKQLATLTPRFAARGLTLRKLTYLDLGLQDAEVRDTWVQAGRPAASAPLAATPLLQHFDWFRWNHGCDVCGHTGYRGRVPLVSLVVIDRASALRAAIASGEATRGLAKVASTHGSRTLFAHGMLRVLKGETTLDAVLSEAGSYADPLQL